MIKEILETGGVGDISAAEFLAVLMRASNRDDIVLLDIRTADEFDVYHLAGAINIDFYSESFAEELSRLDRATLYLIYCRTGRRTGTAEDNARDLMDKLGFKRVLNMLGGIHAFVKENGADDFISE
jgi:rhodanese-related sulfurtransferase